MCCPVVAQLLADDQEEIEVIPAGFIGAAAGLKNIRTGVIDREHDAVLRPITM
jgi:hypothetical protein